MLLKKYLKRTMNCDTTGDTKQPDERMVTLSAADENVYQKLTSNDIS